MFSKNKDSNQSLENINKSFISKRVDGLKSVALVSAVALTMLSGCVSDKEYQEVKMKNDELSASYSEYLETTSALYDEKYEEAKMKNDELSASYREYSDGELALWREYDGKIEEIKSIYDAQNEKLREDIVNFINEYNDYCENTSFDFDDRHQTYFINGYKAKINEYVDYFENYLDHGMVIVNYQELDSKLDDAQETFGALKGYVNAINVEKNIQNSNQEEYELGLE